MMTMLSNPLTFVTCRMNCFSAVMMVDDIVAEHKTD